jgi:hypothetical protein
MPNNNLQGNTTPPIMMPEITGTVTPRYTTQNFGAAAPNNNDQVLGGRINNDQPLNTPSWSSGTMSQRRNIPY